MGDPYTDAVLSLSPSPPLLFTLISVVLILNLARQFFVCIKTDREREREMHWAQLQFLLL